jgi:Carboxypeptidase regulatory-like domain
MTARALVLALLVGATLAIVPLLASASVPTTNVAQRATSTVTPTPDPTPQADQCTAKVTKIVRIDPYHKDATSPVNSGDTLDVTPLYELVMLKLTLDINVPQGDVMTFSDQARINIGTNKKPDWLFVTLRNSKFTPPTVPGKKTGSQDLNYEFRLPPNVDLPDRNPKSLEGENVELTLNWKCNAGGGMLAKFTLHGKKVRLGQIEGTVKDRANSGLFQCQIVLTPAGASGPVVTGVDGGYEFDKLLPGEYTVTATGICGGRQTYTKQSKTTSVEAGKTATVDFTLK